MEDRPCRLLLHGIDTLQCAYYLYPADPGKLDFESLRVMKEDLREAKVKEPAKVVLGEKTFLLHPFGTSSGYPFLMSDEDFKVEFGESNSPSFFVTFRSQALWRESAYSLHQKFLDWSESVGLAPLRPERISRIDCCFDYHLPTVDFETDHFVSRFSKDAVYREDGKVQTFSFGRGDVVLRVYDKVAEIRQQSNKVWFHTLWEMDQDVWRIEWQVRKPILRQFGIVTFEDLKRFQPDLLRYLAEDHTSLRVPDGDTNRSRWPLHPLWADLRESVGQMDLLGVCRINGKEAALEERMVRMAIAVYGYAKRAAAIQCVKKNKEVIPLDEALDSLRNRIAVFHHHFNWSIDVKKRIESIEGGEW